MNFDHIILNSPYSGNLHLKILREAMQYSDDIVNLSPIRWLEDPLAEYKQGSDWKTYEDIRSHIESLEVISMTEACNMFDVPFMMNIGIYHITKNGGFDLTYFKNGIVNKIEKKLTKSLSDVAEENKIDGWRCRIQKISPFPSNLPNGVAAQARLTLICHPYFDWVYKDGYTKDGVFWVDNVHHKAGPKTYTKDDKLPVSIKFNTGEEAYNFQAYTKTKFFKYVYSVMKTDQNVPLKYLPFMPTYTHPWTDTDLYAYFGLTADEISIIEKEMANKTK